jgi:hypothetical protein
MKKFAMAACLSLVLVTAGAQAMESTAVRVYDAGELPLNRYSVIDRLWTGTWRSAFWLPAYDDAGSAISALTTEAGRRGADGVINLHCLHDEGGMTGGYICYGLAIKLK